MAGWFGPMEKETLCEFFLLKSNMIMMMGIANIYGALTKQKAPTKETAFCSRSSILTPKVGRVV